MAASTAPAKTDNYKWVALANTTAAVFMSQLDGSIVLIAMPAIFNGIGLDPLAAGNIAYLLWMIMGFRLVQAVLVVTVGRCGDIFGRVRIYNSGFAVFTVASVLLSFDPFRGSHGADWLIGWRLLQAAGGSMLQANSPAILTDAFPAEQRGFALGTNQVAGLAGMFIGLVAGGILATIDWRLVFWVNVPVGIYGTAWAYWKLRETGERHRARIDWWGNITFAVGLSAVLIGITYGIQPHGHHTMGWTSPFVLSLVIGGLLLLVLFVLIERRVRAPMIELALFKIRAFSAGNIAGFSMSMARGGLQFMIVIWLQGIWLPLHGYSYSRTPLWAGIYMLPLTVGFLVAGPTSGIASDRFGSRGIATAGALLAAAGFAGLLFLPVNFSYAVFALLLLVVGDRTGNVHLAELVLDHGLGPGQPARRCLGDALDLHQHRHRDLDRRVLHADDRRPLAHTARHAHAWVARRRPACRPHPPSRLVAAGLLAVRVAARDQSAQAHARGHGRTRPPAPGGAATADRTPLLPTPADTAVPRRPGRRVRDRHRTVAGGRAGIVPTRWQQVPHPTSRGNMSPESPAPIDPSHAALLVMDYQNGIIAMVDNGDELLAITRNLIRTFREHGGTVGYVRVGFADGDLDDVPATSGMARMVTPERREFMHADHPSTQIHDSIAPEEGDVVVRKQRVGRLQHHRPARAATGPWHRHARPRGDQHRWRRPLDRARRLRPGLPSDRARGRRRRPRRGGRTSSCSSRSSRNAAR